MAWVVFFDGECAMCSRTMRFVSSADRHQQLAFAPLQGELASKMGFAQHAAPGSGTLVLLRKSDQKAFFRTDALIELARILGGGWRVFVLARFIPKRMRDSVYDWVARNRHWLMGTLDSCKLPR